MSDFDIQQSDLDDGTILKYKLSKSRLGIRSEETACEDGDINTQLWKLMWRCGEREPGYA